MMSARGACVRCRRRVALTRLARCRFRIVFGFELATGFFLAARFWPLLQRSVRGLPMNRKEDNAGGFDADRRSLVMLAGAATVLATGTSASAQTSQSSPPLMIVLHVSDPDGWPPALSNARNLSQKYPAVKVRVIADGGGVYGYQGSNDMISVMATTAKAGVEFQACHNALDEKKIPVTSLPPYVTVVPAGVIALAEAQREGYAYVKP